MAAVGETQDRGTLGEGSRFAQIIGTSAALEHVLGQVERVAPTDATVLVLGETGTGKELIARAIHQLSARRGRAFVKLNCAAIPTDLLESELFGHEKGAFTGAVAQKVGRFELARRRHAVPRRGRRHPAGAAAQAAARPAGAGVRAPRAARRRIGSTCAWSPPRTATWRRWSRAGTFRADLYYRLNVFPVHLPPLRERREDIPRW